MKCLELLTDQELINLGFNIGTMPGGGWIAFICQELQDRGVPPIYFSTRPTPTELFLEMNSNLRPD